MVSNIEKLQTAWREDEHALKVIFGEKSFYQVLLTSWPEVKQQEYLNQVNKKYPKLNLTKEDLHVSTDSNGYSHIFIKEVISKDDYYEVVGGHYIVYSKTLIKDNEDRTLIDVSLQNLKKWQGADYICFVWKYDKGNMRVLVDFKKLCKVIFNQEHKHIEKTITFFKITLQDAINNNIVKAYWEDSITDPRLYDVTIFDGIVKTCEVLKGHPQIFSKVNIINDRLYKSKTTHKGGTKLYFPNGEIKEYKLQKDALEDICGFLVRNDIWYTNDEKDKMKNTLKQSVRRSTQKIENFKNNKIDAKDNSIFKSGIYAFSGDISNEDIKSFMKEKYKKQGVTDSQSVNHRDFSTLLNISDHDLKRNESCNITYYYLKGTEVPDNTLNSEYKAAIL